MKLQLASITFIAVYASLMATTSSKALWFFIYYQCAM